MTSVYAGLLIDVGGVLTTDVIAAFDEFCAREGLSGISIRDLYYNSADAQRLFHRLELGELDAVEAQAQLARILGLPETRSDKLFRDIYSGVHLVPDMARSVEVLHASGVRTGVLSNSWWFPIYDDPFYQRAFDVQLVSGHVGLRKPDPKMFERGVEALAVAPELIVFVDDFEENLVPARDLGMVGVLHSPDDPARTIVELERLFGVELTGS